MSMKQIATADDEARFQREARTRRHQMPDSVASDAEDAIGNLMRCVDLLLEIKARACRGDDMAAIEVVVAKDDAYSMRASMEDSLRKMEKTS